MREAKRSRDGELRRQLGLGSATALVVGEVIAVGIFLTPAAMAKSLGSPMLLLVVWLVMGAMALCGSLCYGELASRYPEAGGGYVYLREAYGERMAFLYGWMCFLVMDPGITAALAVGLASNARRLVDLPQWGAPVLAVSSIVALAAANALGVRLGAWVMRWLTWLKLGLLAGIAVWGLARGLGSWANFVPFVERRSASEPLGIALAGGMVAAFFSFGGWWDASKMAGEVRDPARTLPRAFALGVAIVTGVYILTSAVFLYLVPIERVTSDESFAAQAGEALFGTSGKRVFAAIVVVCVLGSLAGLVMTAPRVYYAMARDGVFLPAVARLHPRFGTPVLGIVLQACLASILAAVGSFQQIVAYFIFVTVIFIALTVGSVFVLRRRASESPAYLAAGFPATPLVFLGLVTVLLVLLASQSPREAALGVVVVLLGLPAYRLLVARPRENSS